MNSLSVYTFTFVICYKVNIKYSLLSRTNNPNTLMDRISDYGCLNEYDVFILVIYIHLVYYVTALP